MPSAKKAKTQKKDYYSERDVTYGQVMIDAFVLAAHPILKRINVYNASDKRVIVMKWFEEAVRGESRIAETKK